MPAPSPKKISDFKPVLTTLAQTSHFEVKFSGLKPKLMGHLSARGVFSSFVSSDITLLCHSASLPGSSYATADIVGDYMGVAESMPHTRTFTPIDLSFYVDRSYKAIKFFEHWMEFMHDASSASRLSDYTHFRMQYPEEYKCNSMKIVKFDRDSNRYIEYNFKGLYPKTINAMPVSYDSSEILKVGVSFNYERYVCGSVDSKSINNGTSNNLQSVLGSVGKALSGKGSLSASTQKTGTDKSSPVIGFTGTNEPLILNGGVYNNNLTGYGDTKLSTSPLSSISGSSISGSGSNIINK